MWWYENTIFSPEPRRGLKVWFWLKIVGTILFFLQYDQNDVFDNTEMRTLICIFVASIYYMHYKTDFLYNQYVSIN